MNNLGLNSHQREVFNTLIISITFWHYLLIPHNEAFERKRLEDYLKLKFECK